MLRQVTKNICSFNFLETTFTIISFTQKLGAQWLSGRVLDSRVRGRGFKPHWCHCIVVLEQDTFILA